ncbi:similar to charged multivesicular body protein [Plenodomus lingam JN3]|uniref:Similar to charged multivesicular body protein n=1 Tax=Leptosphaeria maculans (strain JN3 / isolate v23.1.3 / race Av1-4-5-6-7-8) TaxID=985895 RepID=E5A8U9_LEPMJ|nr:similar to charged multivesicular body protein [Plenodomus lingam JN3]CBY00044.1 similar to charged multivesicular body protein [Plenodomus lingam JN3]
MSGLENALFNLKFTAKSLNRQALKAGKEEQAEKMKLEKAMKQGHNDIARIYAGNAIRKQNEKLNLLQLASRVDAVAGRVQTAVTMRQITGNMMKVNRSLDVAMKSMNPERKADQVFQTNQVAAVMVDFEKQFENVDSATELYQDITSSATAVGTPQEDVDRLMAQAADKAGVDLQQDLQEATPSKQKVGPTEQEEEAFTERLRALRN